MTQVYSGVNEGLSKAGTDTFYLYGGPPSFPTANVHPAPSPWPNGMFQSFLAGGSPEVQGWTSEDQSDPPVYWHGSLTNAQSSTVASDSLFPDPGTGNPNQCVASHHTATTPVDYTGYGNLWKDWLVFDYDMSNLPGHNPGDPATVQYTLWYKSDLEKCCDFLTFEWYSADPGTGWQTISALDGTTFGDDASMPTPVQRYKARFFDSSDPTHDGGVTPISYGASDYFVDGSGHDHIRLRVSVVSDTGWSDADGLNPTFGRGGSFLDDINVIVNGVNVSSADWEGAPALTQDDAEGTLSPQINNGSGAGTAGWLPMPATFSGDFSKVIAAFVEGDIDICRENNTPMLSWINDGTGCKNDPLGLPNGSGIPASVGSTSYGIPTGAGAGTVFEYQGGLLPAGEGGVSNKWKSPIIRVNPPGSSPTNGGFALGWTAWQDLPYGNLIFWRYSVRSHDPVSGGWSPWQDCTYHYYGPQSAWANNATSITDKLVPGADSLQVGFMGIDGAVIFTGSPSTDATPAPEMDNVYVKRYEIGGPVILVPPNSLFQDSFPPNGTTTSAVRFDPGANIGGTGSSTVNYVPQDSLAVQVQTIITGTHLAGFGKMFVAHLQNPTFDQTVRGSGIADVNNYSLAGASTDVAHNGWPIYTYDVDGQQCTLNGSVVDDQYFFDLPDGLGYGVYGHADEDSLVFPGDVVHYYLEFTDDQAIPGVSRTVTSTTDFLNFEWNSTYPLSQTMRALPTVDGAGDHPGALWWNDVDNRGNDRDMLLAFAQNGMLQGRDFDYYITKGASSGMGNGLGSAGEHGATAGQLSGYDCLFYTLGTNTQPALSNGNKGVDGNDWSDDVSLVTDWHNQDADRFSAYFGENFANSMNDQTNGAFLTSVLGVQWSSDDLNATVGMTGLDNQTAALVKPTGAVSSFVTNYSPYGGCLAINTWDAIEPVGGSGAVVAHEFTDPDGNFYTDVPRVASVFWDRTVNGFQKVDITFPYDPVFILDQFTNPASTGPNTARSYVLGEILSAFGKTTGAATGAGVLPKKLVVSQNYPNPFNPSTTIKYSMPIKGQVSIKVYNLHGALVTTLADGIQDAGDHTVIWNGKDTHGASVSTGIYLYKVKTMNSEVVKKMALIK
jgi:hypothetical protein